MTVLRWRRAGEGREIASGLRASCVTPARLPGAAYEAHRRGNKLFQN
jgi:hypothetical protein